MTFKEWFPTKPDGSNGWRLDIVSLLAVIGEASMSQHVQPLTATSLCYLPRIIPAPQALLYSSRPARMPDYPAKVVGVKSGNDVNTLNYFANLIHKVETLRPYECRVYNVSHSALGIKYNTGTGPRIPPKRFSPLNVLTVVSFLLTLGLLGWSIAIKDGVACLALFTISIASSTIGLASRWQLKMAERREKAKVPDGDVVIRTREGAFIVVRCQEEVARELYIGTEECNYLVPENSFRALVGLGTLLLMVSVVLLGNCNWTMQLVVGISYIALNGAYWVAALMPKTLFWDLARYDVEFEKGTWTTCDTFTEALWFVIYHTGQIEWVKRSGAAPKTVKWDKWLALAQENVKDPTWDSVRAKNELFMDVESNWTNDNESARLPAEETSPAQEVALEPRIK